jgi:hypothetical protein
MSGVRSRRRGRAARSTSDKNHALCSAPPDRINTYAPEGRIRDRHGRRAWDAVDAPACPPNPFSRCRHHSLSMASWVRFRIFRIWLDGQVETGILRFGPVPQRGDTRSSRPRGGMRWTLMALRTNALKRTAKSCGPDAPTLASSLREATFAGDGGKQAGHRGEREISRKPLRGECRAFSGVTVVTNARAYYQYTRGCGRIGRPAFPAPSE